MRKIIDQNGRLFGKISIIDVIALFAVVILALAIHQKAQLPVTSVTNDTTITFVAFAENIPDYALSSIQVGDLVYDKTYASGGAIGKIIDIQVQPGTKSKMMTAFGTAITAEVEGASDLILTIEGRGTVTDGRFFFNRVYELGLNASRQFYTKFARFDGVVSSIG